MNILAAIAALLFVSSASAKELLLSCAPALPGSTVKVSVWKTLDDYGLRKVIVEETIPGKKKIRSTMYDWEIWRLSNSRKIPLAYSNSKYMLEGKEDLWTVSWGRLGENRLTPEETHCTQYAPDFKLEEVSTEKTVRLTDLLKTHKVVLVNIFNTWCGPCKDETPDLVTVRSEYKGRGVEFVSISTTLRDDAAKVASFARSYSMKWPVLFDANDDVAMDYSLHAVPVTCIVKKDRSISYCNVNALKKDKLKQLIDQALR